MANDFCQLQINKPIYDSLFYRKNVPSIIRFKFEYMSLDKANKKVLIVDDEPHIRMALSFLVKKEGYQVAQAVNGKDALRVLKDFTPDVAILDVMMPEMDGLSLAKHMRGAENLNQTAIIFLSAKGTQEDRFDGYQTGAEVYLTKPFDNEQLINTLNEVVQFG